jgi:hypothetical protein
MAWNPQRPNVMVEHVRAELRGRARPAPAAAVQSAA